MAPPEYDLVEASKVLWQLLSQEWKQTHSCHKQWHHDRKSAGTEAKVALHA